LDQFHLSNSAIFLLKFAFILHSREICCACARFPLKLEDFPEEITKCSWLLYIFECLFNLYNFFARDKDKDKVKCTLRLQCIEYLVCVWTAIEYYNLDTNKKTFDTLNLQSCLPIIASLTALSNEKQVRISGFKQEEVQC
jgi:hypothetical protein